MMIEVIFILMVAFAFASIQAKNLKTAVIYLGLYSMISSFAYLLLSAPDVAIAEAVIGCTLASIIYLVALQKYKVFNICYINREFNVSNDRVVAAKKSNLIHLVEEYCSTKDLDPYITYLAGDLEEHLKSFKHDLIIYHEGKKIYFYGRKRNYHITNICKYITRRKYIDKEKLDFKMMIH